MNSVLWKKYPFASRSLFWVAIPFGAVVAVLYLALSGSLAQVTGEFSIRGLDAKVIVKRDRYSIPEIHALTDHDAYFGLGYAHAQDRLWQMEMNRIIAAGRLSEVVGKSAVHSDIAMRRLGLFDNAKRIWRNLDPESKKVLLAYVDGVNAGMSELSVLPPEFYLTGVKPELWKPEDSLLLMQMLAWELGSNFNSEIYRTLLVQHYGTAIAESIMPGVPADLAKILAVTNNSDVNKYATTGSFANIFSPGERSIGSNAWVISGKNTASGAPILANDPHLATPIPSLWYLISIKGRTLNASGGTMPGLPFILVGKNTDIAWGMTNAYVDTQDLIVEEINPLNKNQYKYGNEYVDMELKREEIRVKSDFLRPLQDPVHITVRRTRNGPVLSDITNPLGKMTLSLKWTGDLDNGGTFRSFVKMNYAKNWKEFNEALSTYVAPIHNFVYADKRGNIGVVTPGLYPVRSIGNGSVPVSSRFAPSLWKGMIPFSDVPRTFNPPEGYIVLANNKFVPREYPYQVSSDFQPSYRADRIRSELDRLIKETNAKVTSEQMGKLQLDVLTPSFGNGFLHKMQSLPPREDHQRRPLAILKAWDGRMDENSNAATLFASWTSHLNIVLLEKIKEKYARPDVADEPLARMKFGDNEEFLERVILGRDRSWCKMFSADVTGSCDELLYLALDRAITELTYRLGSDESKWAWGKVHRVVFGHFPFSKSELTPEVPAVEESLISTLFDRSIASPGGNDTVDSGAVSFNKKTKYDQFFGAMYRQVIDLGGNYPGLFMQGTGQSGNPLSTHYDDLIELHQKGVYISMGKRPVNSTLILSPTSRSAN